MNQSFFNLFSFFFFVLITFSSCQTRKIADSRPEEPETSIVFEPVRGEYASMRIPALVISQKGTLLAFCEGRIGTASDWADMDMLMRRSTDGGRTWGPIKIIAPRQGGNPISNATPIVDKNGTIHLLYQRDYARAFYTQSNDDGITWSPAVDITYAFEEFKPEYDWKVLAPGPGHSIQLRDGRLLVPVWLSDPAKLKPRRSHYPSRIATIYSDDLGKTWHRGEFIPKNEPEVHSPSESMAVELADGRVMLNIRHSGKAHWRAVSFSKDGISGWTKPVLDEELFEPICMASILRISGGKNRLLFINPDSESIEKYPRKNLTVKLSYDAGQNWTTEKVLNAGPSGYSDLAVGPNGTLYCLYETNTTGTGWNYSLLLKRFSLEWLTDGKDKSK